MTDPMPLLAFQDNYIWVMCGSKKNSIVCVDPGEAEPVLQHTMANKLCLEAILLTHHHADHIGGVPRLLEYFPECTVYGPSDKRVPTIQYELADNDIITVGTNTYTVINIPGHTSTHICFYEKQHEWLFCGDTLFSAGCGRVFDGTMEELYHSLQVLKELPDSTKVFCAHEYTLSNLKFAAAIEPSNKYVAHYLKKLQNIPRPCTLPSTIGREKQINPFLRSHLSSIVPLRTSTKEIGNDLFERFKFLRKLKDTFN